MRGPHQRILAAALAALTTLAPAQTGSSPALTPETRAQVDTAVKLVIGRTGVPSASVGIVQGGVITFTSAYGNARLDPAVPADPAMHYAVGSISKQFTAACVLLLAEDGKLKLDDPVSKWFPDLTRASEVTLRNLLTHTSGYSDYAPQDYTIPAWTTAIDPQIVVNEWAKKPLDFDPGTKWQYSNTNFVLAGLIVQKVAKEPFWNFLRDRVLKPLELKDVLNLDTDRDHMEPRGYERRALAPLRPAILEAPGWYFADGELAMPVATLLDWDRALMAGKLLKPESYKEFFTSMKLRDGTDTHYGLGVSIGARDGHRVISHSGEVGGFVAQNTLLPDDGIAVAVLTNQEASPAASAIARGILPILLGPGKAAAGTTEAESQTRGVLAALQQGRIDRSLLTGDANYYFSPETLTDYQTSLAPLGDIKSVSQRQQELRGGMTARIFDVVFGDGTGVVVSTYSMPDGRLEQFLVEAKP